MPEPLDVDAALDLVADHLAEMFGLPRDGIDLAARLVDDLGIDSLDAVDALISVQDTHRLAYDREPDVGGLDTVGDMVALLLGAVPAAPAVPEVDGLAWRHDAMHYPRPMTRLEVSLLQRCFPPAFAAAFRAYDLGHDGYVLRRRGGYVESAFVPRPGGGSEAGLRAALATFAARWDQEMLPRITAAIERWAKVDPVALDDDAAVAHARDTLARHDRIMADHFLVVFPAYTAISEAEEAWGRPAVQELVHGQANRTVEAGDALRWLADRARSSPDVAAALAGPAALAALDASEDGRAFRAEFDAYLREYGHLGDLWYLSSPCWRETPEVPLDMIRRLADAEPVRPAAPVPAGGPEAEAVREAVRITEDHGFYIEYAWAAEVRRVVLDLGRRLAERGTLDHPDGVFTLTLGELFRVLAADPPLDLRAVTAAERDWLASREGALPLPAPVDANPDPPDSAFARAMGKFFGSPAPACPPAATPGLVVGSPGASGRAEGPARVLASLADADRVRPGDVLVAETTAPPWTPLFGVVAAVVTGTGGHLSHGAVVAREYGIPAVVGAAAATRAIRDGDWVEVDGDRGQVRYRSAR